MELTSKKYWQEYYKEAAEDRDTIVKICGAYDFFWQLLIRSCSFSPRTILEIGAFPGRYLAYLASNYNLSVTGLDFNTDRDKFSRTMHEMGVNEFNYVCSDFLQHIPEEKYDLVFSNGFIEHFTNFDEVLDKHVDYLNPGGAMMIMIPNKRYLRQIYGYLVDYRNLKAHNLRCMTLDVFAAFAKRNNLQINYLSYYGGFGFKVHQRLSVMQRLLYHPIRFLSIRFHSLLRRHPSKWYSGTIVAIVSKPIAG
ncbi:MAG: class I SAM-dependent methyltransferase [Cyclobacteriaceae bacterium]|nr:class I SAM-dependent methyltransferase [Cyclobacteriaceae bacterium]